jgi:hypothetical protein
MRRAIQRILREHRSVWDNDCFRPDTRRMFNQVLKCGTAELGARVFASESGERRFSYFSCKQKLCPGCGHKRTLDWVEEISRRLPQTTYASVGFSMHENLWGIFRDNPTLLRDLPALGIGVMQDHVQSRYSAKVAGFAVTHTFGGDLKFYPHVHAVISTTGLTDSGKEVVQDISFSKDIVMQQWRHTLVNYLRNLHSAGAITSSKSDRELRQIFDVEIDRWWTGQIKEVDSKRACLEYICRYARRAAFANRNVLSFDKETVTILLKDTRLKRRERETIETSLFLKKLEQHIAPQYSHAVHYFGLLSPRSSNALAIYRAHLKDPVGRKAPRLSWEIRVQAATGKNPLIDSNGRRMTLERTIFPSKNH